MITIGPGDMNIIGPREDLGGEIAPKQTVVLALGYSPLMTVEAVREDRVVDVVYWSEVRGEFVREAFDSDVLRVVT